MSLKAEAPLLARSLSVLVAALALLSMGAARGQETKEIYRPSGDEGAIKGTISFEGEPPRQRLIDESADAACMEMERNPKLDDVIITRGKVANVFVYLKSGPVLERYSFETPSSEVVLEHKRCRYEPHVLGIREGQTLKIFNRDPTIHNTHPTPKMNPEWNWSQAPGSPPIEKTFLHAEQFIPFKDNQHPWQMAYLGVFSHPFFAVSSRDGSYVIPAVPPGRYTIVAWHERLGERTMEIVVNRNETKIVDFAFAPVRGAGY